MKPVVFRSLARRWPCTRKWSLAYLAECCGSVVLPVYDSIDQSNTIRDFSLARKKPYLRSIFLRKYLSALVEDVQLPHFVKPNYLEHPELQSRIPELWNPWYELFLSGPGARFPYIHQDAHGTHAWIAQIRGRKRVWFWPPDTDPAGARFDVSEGQAIEDAFPQSKPVVVHLHPGDVVWVPSNWWHTAEAQSVSISISGNFVNSSNRDRFRDSYFCKSSSKSSLNAESTFASMNSH